MKINQLILAGFMAVSLFGDSLCTTTVPQPKFTPNRTIIEDFYDFFGLEEYGYGDVSLKNENFIRDIQKEMGMENDYIRIRRMSYEAIRAQGRENAFVVGDHKILYISEDWFNTLTNEEKRHLIGHELSHLKFNHIQQKRFVDLAALIGSGVLAFAAINSVFPDRDFEKYKANTALGVAGVAAALVSTWFSRVCEREADRYAAHKLNNAQGGVSLIKRLIRETEDLQSRFFIKRVINRFASWTTKFLSTHPELSEREAYLTKMVAQQA